MTLAIDSVTTGDAHPSDAPHRISAHATKNQAVVKFTPPGITRGWVLTLDGGRLSGRVLAKAGAICGMERCGDGCEPLASTGQITATVTYLSTGPAADGAHTVEVNAATDSGWA